MSQCQPCTQHIVKDLCWIDHQFATELHSYRLSKLLRLALVVYWFYVCNSKVSMFPSLNLKSLIFTSFHYAL